MRKKGEVIVLLLMLFVISGCSLVQDCEEQDVPIVSVEEFTADEPYTVQECHSKEFAYQVSNLHKTIIHHNENSTPRYFLEASFDITNLEDDRGDFNYQMKFEQGREFFGCIDTADFYANNKPYINVLGDHYSGLRKEILAMSTVKVRCSLLKTTELGSVTATATDIVVIPPTKQVCDPVTKYRTTTRNKTTTRYDKKTVCN